jgi:hypothetical protein
MNQTLQKGLSAAQVPSRADADHLVVLVRGMEDRLLERLAKIEQRLGQLEQRGASKAKSKAESE